MKYALTTISILSIAFLAGCTTTNTVNTNEPIQVQETITTETTSNSNEDTDVVENTNNDEVTTDVVVTSDEVLRSPEGVADWLTYTNEEYGFSFKYPDTYSISTRDGYKGDFTENNGVIFVFQQKDITSIDYPARIVLFEDIIDHPSTDEINGVAFAEGPNKIGQSFDHVISETSYSGNQYSGKKFRLQNLTGGGILDDEHKLKDVGDFYYLDSDSRTILVHLTDGAAMKVDPNALLNSLQF